MAERYYAMKIESRLCKDIKFPIYGIFENNDNTVEQEVTNIYHRLLKNSDTLVKLDMCVTGYEEVDKTRYDESEKFRLTNLKYLCFILDTCYKRYREIVKQRVLNDVHEYFNNLKMKVIFSNSKQYRIIGVFAVLCILYWLVIHYNIHF